MPLALKKDYASPRWSGEITDCSMPMTFDTYSLCSFNCLYCFSFFQKEHSLRGYLDREVRCVNTRHTKDMFLTALFGNVERKISKKDAEFVDYIKNRYTMQWGGLSDPFDNYERRFGVTLELLKFFSGVRYPLSISTKGTWFSKDERYMELIRKNHDIWHFKVSVITLDGLKAKGIERGVDSPKERIETIKRLAEAGCAVTLRLRPYMIGISDDYKSLIEAAKTAGADSVTTEFFCLETRATERLRQKYLEMSRFAGFDIWDFYKEHSKGSGYLRLNYELKKPIILAMQELTHSLGIRFYVSDAHHKEKCDYCCCCGVPPERKVSRGHFAEALLIAKSRNDGLVRWSDIKKDLETYTPAIKTIGDHPTGFNTGNNRNRAQRRHMTILQWIKEMWNTPKSAKSPFGYFGGVLYPVGLDEDGNVVYKYNKEKAEATNGKTNMG